MSSIRRDKDNIHIVQAVSIRWFNACAHYALSLARGFDKLGYRVTVAGDPDTPAIQMARQHNLSVLPLSTPSSLNIPGYLRLIRTIRSFAVDERVSIVNVHSGTDHTAWLLGLRGKAIPVIRTSGNQYPPKVHPLSRTIINKTDAIIASSGLIRNYYLNAFGKSVNEVPVINGGVDEDFFSPEHRNFSLRSEYGIPADAFVFGIIGRFSPVKGHRYFFEAAERITKSHPDAWFLVAGWDAQLKHDDIREMARKAAVLERTCFAGRLDNSRALIGMIDAGIITSTGSETICRIAMEYMAMGVPVIAADTNSIPEIIHDGVSGIIVPSGNSTALAEAMEKIIGNRQYALDLGKGGRQIVEKELSLTVFAQKTLDIYRRFGLNAERSW